MKLINRMHAIFHVAKSKLCSHDLSFCMHKFIIDQEADYMKNIFIEGIQGMGKTTLLNHISSAIPALHTCHEGDHSPVELAWCAWMTDEEYTQLLERYGSIRNEIIKNTVQEQEHFIVSYTKIITDIPDFHKELEKFEIYNGRKPLQDFKNIVFSRYENFSKTGYLFECSFFQNIVEDLILFHQLSDDEIVKFYHELYTKINERQFLLFYLYSDKLEENIELIKKERCDEHGDEIWYSLILKYVACSPYGKKQGYHTFEDIITHFRHRQQLELRIIKEIIGKRAIIVPAKNWKIEEILPRINEPQR